MSRSTSFLSLRWTSTERVESPSSFPLPLFSISVFCQLSREQYDLLVPKGSWGGVRRMWGNRFRHVVSWALIFSQTSSFLKTTHATTGLVLVPRESLSYPSCNSSTTSDGGRDVEGVGSKGVDDSCSPRDTFRGTCLSGVYSRRYKIPDYNQ